MIYGANGYTGEMIAREAKRRGLAPILAGRSAGKVESLSRELGLAHRTFGLDSPAAVDAGLEGMGLVLHCAGPFSQTAEPMLEGCLRNKSHYLDITGEIPVFEYAHAQQERARLAHVVLCPGVGFDVIPTDCVARALKDALPDATHLVLGFDQPTVLSPGTAKTSVEFAGKGGRVRNNGAIVTVPLGHSARRIDFGNGRKLAMAIPWGDVSTAYYSTGIPNVAVYIPASPLVILGAKIANLFGPVLRLEYVVATLQRWITKRVHGPDTAARGRMPSYVWGEAANPSGEKRTARIKTANGYSLTTTGSLEVVQYLLRNDVPGGAYTPSMLMGPGLVSRLPESGPIIIERQGSTLGPSCVRASTRNGV
jgi:short subunit dehydrogenase-like uncharacterized protein